MWALREHDNRFNLYFLYNMRHGYISAGTRDVWCTVHRLSKISIGL
jgi:hypothetical protein